ncbi:MAG: hypothetical protein AB7L13_12225 [Acidimicrobiia bacterium]
MDEVTRARSPEEPAELVERGAAATMWHTTPVLLGAVVWALHLAAIYVTSSLLHKTGNADHDWLGSLSSEDTLVLVLTVVAAVPTALVSWAGWRAWSGSRERRHERGSGIDDTVNGFAGELSALVNLLFLFAIVIEGIVVVFLPS